MLNRNGSRVGVASIRSKIGHSHRVLDVSDKATEISSLRQKVEQLTGYVGTLKEKNTSLKKQLEDAYKNLQTIEPSDHQILDTIGKHGTPQHEIIAADVSYEDFADLSTKYNTLIKQHKQYKRYFEPREAKYQAARISLARWKQVLSGRKQNGLSIEESREVGQEKTPDVEISYLSPVSMVQRGDNNDILSRTPLPHDPQNVLLRNKGSTKTKKTEVGKCPSSETTDDSMEAVQSPNKRSIEDFQDDDDVPIVVKSRSVKKSKCVGGTVSNLRSTTLQTYGRVKQEPLSSPPLAAMSEAALTRTETLNLDEVGQTISTPRKKKCLGELWEQAREQQHRRSPGNKWRPRRPWSARRNVGNQTSLTSEHPTRLSNQVEDGFQAHNVSGKENAARKNDNSVAESICPASDEQSDDFSASTTSRRVLSDLSTNNQTMPRSLAPKQQRIVKDVESRGAAAIPYVAEDGEGQNDDVFIASKPVVSLFDAVEKKTDVESRLNSLLAAPSPAKQLLSPTKTPLTRPNGLQATPEVSSFSTKFSTPVTVIKFNGEKNHAAHVKRNPLRKCAMETLTRDDFKVNPKFNQGMDHAFTETVRNREARRCLPGCTRPDCCGNTFRKVIELGGAPPMPCCGLWNSSQDSTTEEDRLLTEYLGDDSVRLGRLNAEERRELLLQAQAKLLADSHGRHRQAFERRKTPPGFWRADMPSTQEIERDREVAIRMEKETVAERHREAMRKNGRWLFRDESV